SGLTLTASGFPRSVQLISASATRGTLSVPVSRIGVSSTPSSATCAKPHVLPNPLSTNAAAGVFSRNGSPACVRIAVTPVRMASPSTSDACPTATPGTSVIAFSPPGGSDPRTIPTSRGRRRGTLLAPRGTRHQDSQDGVGDALDVAVVELAHVQPDRPFVWTAQGRDRRAAGQQLVEQVGSGQPLGRVQPEVDGRVGPADVILRDVLGLGVDEPAELVGQPERALLSRAPLGP